MELLICIAAATVGFVLRAIWYMVLKTPWQRAVGAPVVNRGYPFDQSPLPYLVAGACLLVMAVMMRGLFLHYRIDTMTDGLGVGLGMGLLIAVPLILMHDIPPRRSMTLTLIDGGHAVLVLAVMGAILGAL